MKSLKVCFIGYGSIAKRHISNLYKLCKDKKIGLSIDVLRHSNVINKKVDKKNEGKLVLVSGKIEYDNLVTFLELDEGLKTIKINRKVEDYIKYEDSNGKTKYKWEERLEPLSDNDHDYTKNLISSEKVSNVNIYH